ncbi:hypothetical protein ACNKHS_10780 [Shigella flexneri]
MQAAALPAILEGRDVHVRAKTGSGRSGWYGSGPVQHSSCNPVSTRSNSADA